MLIDRLLKSTAYCDYALVPICVGIWALFGGWIWLVCAAISLFTAYWKPLPRFHAWLLGRMMHARH